MRVLHVISGLDPILGGTSTALFGMAVAQARAGLDVRVISTWVTRPGHEAAARLEAVGVRTTLVRASNPLSHSPRLPGILDQLIADADVIHIHALWESIQHHAAIICRRRRTPYLITPHGMLSRWSLSQHAIRKRLYLAWRLRKNLAAASALHFTTAAERESTAALRLPPPAIVEPLGLHFSEFAPLPRRGSFRERYSLSPTRPMIAFLGRIHSAKGLEYLVPALARLNKLDVMLVVIGPDSRGFRRHVELEIDRLGLHDRVIFTGMLQNEEKLSALVDADLFCLPSRHENFGMSVIEALAVGTPVVISDQVNIQSEIAAAGVGGVVPLDVGVLADELGKWLADDMLRQRAAAAAPLFVRRTYDWDAIGARWVGHYDSLVSGDLAAVSPAPAAAQERRSHI